MTEPLKISGLQMHVSHDVTGNAGRIERGIQYAADMGAHWLLTPEGALSGYYTGFDRLQVAEAVERIAAAARGAGVGLALGTCYKDCDGEREYCWNQVRIYSPEGAYLGFQDPAL